MGTRLISIYAASVKYFGSEIVSKALEGGVSDQEITNAMGSFVAGPVMQARKKTGPHAEVWGGRMPTFRIGGGRHHPAYQSIFQWAEESLGNSKFRTSFVEESLDLDSVVNMDRTLTQNKNSARLLVALGLSWSIHDMPRWLTSGQIPDFAEERSLDFEARYVGQEMT